MAADPLFGLYLLLGVLIAAVLVGLAYLIDGRWPWDCRPRRRVR